jgi:hypothetical protein
MRRAGRLPHQSPQQKASAGQQNQKSPAVAASGCLDEPTDDLLEMLFATGRAPRVHLGDSRLTAAGGVGLNAGEAIDQGVKAIAGTRNVADAVRWVRGIGMIIPVRPDLSALGADPLLPAFLELAIQTPRSDRQHACRGPSWQLPGTLF